MTKIVIKLDPMTIDGFMFKEEATRRKCAYKGCRRKARVRVFWKSEGAANQEREDVCVNHAIDLANDILLKRKFGR